MVGALTRDANAELNHNSKAEISAYRPTVERGRGRGNYSTRITLGTAAIYQRGSGHSAISQAANSPGKIRSFSPFFNRVEAVIHRIETREQMRKSCFPLRLRPRTKDITAAVHHVEHFRLCHIKALPRIDNMPRLRAKIPAQCLFDNGLQRIDDSLGFGRTLRNARDCHSSPCCSRRTDQRILTPISSKCFGG